MKFLVTLALVLTSTVASAQIFHGTDNRGQACEVEMGIAKKKNVLEITIRADGEELTSTVKAKSKLKKIRKITYLGNVGESMKDQELYARVTLKDAKPVSFTLRKEVLLLTRVLEYPNYGGYNTWDRYQFPNERTHITVLSSSLVKCVIE